MGPTRSGGVTAAPGRAVHPRPRVRHCPQFRQPRQSASRRSTFRYTSLEVALSGFERCKTINREEGGGEEKRYRSAPPERLAPRARGGVIRDADEHEHAQNWDRVRQRLDHSSAGLPAGARAVRACDEPSRYLPSSPPPCEGLTRREARPRDRARDARRAGSRHAAIDTSVRSRVIVPNVTGSLGVTWTRTLRITWLRASAPPRRRASNPRRAVRARV